MSVVSEVSHWHLPPSVVRLLASRYFVPCCFVFYIALRLAILLIHPVEQSSDFLWYMNAARSIAEGRGYSEHGILTAFWPVGWPGVLGGLFWVFGPHALVGQLANIAFAAGVFFLVLRLGPVLTNDPLVGRIAVALLTAYPNQIAYVPALSTEIFYEFLLLLGVALLMRRRVAWWFGAGVVFGIASLTKAQTPPIPACLLVGWWLVSSPKPKLGIAMARLAVVYAAMILTVGPWTARNYAVFDAFVPVSTNGGAGLINGNNPSATGGDAEDDPLPAALSHDPARQIATDQLARKEALDWIKTHKLRFAELIPLKAIHLWLLDGEGEWFFQRGYPGYQAHVLAFRAVRVINQLYYWMLLALAAASLLVVPIRRTHVSPWLASGWVLVLYATAISIVFSGQTRYHFSLMPWVVIYAACTIAYWYSASRAGMVRPPAVGLERLRA